MKQTTLFLVLLFSVSYSIELPSLSNLKKSVLGDFSHPHETYKEWEQQSIPLDISMIDVGIQASGGTMKAQIVIPKDIIDDVLAKALNKHLWKEWKNEESYYVSTHNWDASLISNGIELQMRLCVGAKLVGWFHQSFDLKTKISFSDLKLSNGQLSASIDLDEIKLQNFDSKLGSVIGIVVNQITPVIRNIISSQISKTVEQMGTQIVQSHSVLSSLQPLKDSTIAIEIKDEQVTLTASSLLQNIKVEL